MEMLIKGNIRNSPITYCVPIHIKPVVGHHNTYKRPNSRCCLVGWLIFQNWELKLLSLAYVLQCFLMPIKVSIIIILGLHMFFCFCILCVTMFPVHHWEPPEALLLYLYFWHNLSNLIHIGGILYINFSLFFLYFITVNVI